MHIAGFAHAFTLSLGDSESSHKQPNDHRHGHHFRKMKRKTRLFIILSTCGLIFTDCSLRSTKPIQTITIENQVVSFDTLKSRFEKGEIIEVELIRDEEYI